MGVRDLGLALLAMVWLGPGLASAQDAAAGDGARFQEANAMVRGGDFPKGMEAYRELASSGIESGSLYWNWAQAAAARGSVGEAMWALQRGREIEPADEALGREIDRVRQAANLDPAEIAPEPLAVLGRVCRRFHLGLVVLLLGVGSLAFHAMGRVWPDRRRFVAAAWICLAVSLGVAVIPLAASQARPTAVVASRDAPLLESASPSAEILGSLREAEVVPILEGAGDYLRIEDSSGARGWVHIADVWRLDRPPDPRP